MSGNLAELIMAEAAKRESENRMLHASTMESYRQAIARAASGDIAKPAEAKQLLEVLGRLSLTADDFAKDVAVYMQHQKATAAGSAEVQQAAQERHAKLLAEFREMETVTLPAKRQEVGAAHQNLTSISMQRMQAEQLERENPRIFGKEPA